jgi:hypothetical protein
MTSKCLINERLTLNVSPKTEEDTEAAGPEHTETLEACDCPLLIKQKIEGKRRLQRLAPITNDCIHTFLQDLTPSEPTDYSLWKVSKDLQQVLTALQDTPSLNT